MKHSLIYDLSITGHHTEYIAHLVDHIVVNKQNEVFYFVVPLAFQLKFPHIVNLAKNSPIVFWEFVSDEEIEYVNSLTLIRRSFAEMKLVDRYAKRFKVEHAYLMNFNIFQVPLIIKRFSYAISGILFLQFYRLSHHSFRQKLKYYRKFLITKLYCINPCLRNVFILNDKLTVDSLNERFNTKIFKVLSDPIPEYQSEIAFDVYKYYNIPESKKILLHPGSIDPRKGTYEIIEAVNYLDNSLSSKYSVLIVGRANDCTDKEIKCRINNLKNKEFQIVYDNSFVSNERLKSLFIQSFAILMPYKNTETSSGILGHAANAKKSVIAPNSGLIRDLVSKYKLGILIEKVDAVHIADGIDALSTFEPKYELFDNFVDEHSVCLFCKTFIDN